MDLIDRQAAIEAIEQHKTAVLGEREWDDGIAYGYAAAHRHLVDIVKQLPSAQPTQTNKSNALKSLDCISRQAAIEAVNSYMADNWIEDSDWHADGIAYEIRRLPSAEPKIIRCKDCKHWTDENGGFCDIWDHYISNEEFFCGCGEMRSSDEKKA